VGFAVLTSSQRHDVSVGVSDHEVTSCIPDGCEIGYTWLSSSAIRTASNTEAKLLMLAHAFEVWQVLRVCFQTDVRNQRSRAGLERIGGQFEGILRAHRMAADYTPRDSARYSIVTAEWPTVKQRLAQLIDRACPTSARLISRISPHGHHLEVGPQRLPKARCRPD
jgi:hypothetical protein